jgi:sarcosine oxidase subunit gamma
MMSLYEALAAQLEDQAVLTDQGHGRVCLRLSGPALTQILAKGSTLDFDPGQDFDPGRSVNTTLGHMAVTLHRLDEETADIYCARSFAIGVKDWLLHAAGEYGCRVTDPI